MALKGKHSGYGTIVSITTGDEVICCGNTLLALNIAGTATATFQVKCPSGTWRTLTDGAITTAATGMWYFDFPVSVRVRLNVSAWTSGDVDWEILSNPIGF